MKQNASSFTKKKINEDEESEEAKLSFSQITYQKWFVNVKIVINNEFQVQTIALLDTMADLNCIKEGLIPTKYFEKIKESLHAANGKKLKIHFKLLNILVQSQNACYQITFLLVKDLTKEVILGFPFLNLFKSFVVSNEGIMNLDTKEVIFSFVSKPTPKVIDLAILKNLINSLISNKKQQIDFLKEEISFKRIEERLNN